MLPNIPETPRLRRDQINQCPMVMEISILFMLFRIKLGKRTRGNAFALVKEQSRLDIRKYPFLPKDLQCIYVHLVYS